MPWLLFLLEQLERGWYNQIVLSSLIVFPSIRKNLFSVSAFSCSSPAETKFGEGKSLVLLNEHGIGGRILPMSTHGLVPSALFYVLVFYMINIDFSWIWGSFSEACNPNDAPVIWTKKLASEKFMHFPALVLSLAFESKPLHAFSQ